MGKIAEVYYDGTLNVEPSRNPNLLRIQRAPNNEVTIHIRNMKIVLHTPEEIAEWRDGFKYALDNLQ